MANSYHTQTIAASQATNTTYTYTIKTQNVTDIQVRIAGHLQTVNTHYTIIDYVASSGFKVRFTKYFDGATTITLGSGTSPYLPESELKVSRVTPLAARHTYNAGSALKSSELNNNQTQALYKLEELDETGTSSTGTADLAKGLTGDPNISVSKVDINNTALIFNDAGTDDIDHIWWKDDAAEYSGVTYNGIYYFCGDTTYRSTSTHTVIKAGTYLGKGTELTNLNGSNISTGTVAAARIADLDSAKITSGTLNVARLPQRSTVTITNATSGTHTGSNATYQGQHDNHISATDSVYTEILTADGAACYTLLSIKVNRKCWVTLYNSGTARHNDASRIETTDPLPGSGVIAEIVSADATEGSPKTYHFTPGVIGWNDLTGTDASHKNRIPIRVKSKESGTIAAGDLDVMLTFIKTEIQ